MAPAPELCFFITWLRLRSGCALLIHFNNFSIPTPSALLVASERVIPTYFELIFKHCYHYQACVVEVEGVWS